MSTITIDEFKALAKKGRVSTGKKAKPKGSKAKGEMLLMLKLTGLEFKPEYRFSREREFRFDWAIPSLKIGIEYEGVISDVSRHTTIRGFSEDCIKYNLAAKEGWKVLRYTARNYKGLISDLNYIAGWRV